jgi:GNAT superfamily N-acetyltransferase
MAVQIRPAVDSDIPELVRLVGEMAAYHESLDERARFDWKEIRGSERWLRLVLARDHHAIWVADHGEGILVGYLWVHLRRLREGYQPPVVGYISHAFLEEHWRGQGLMRGMLEIAYDWFRVKGMTVVTLGVQHRNWAGSAAWYRLGFQDWSHERRLTLKPAKSGS